jgi:hypothetical protein
MANRSEILKLLIDSVASGDNIRESPRWEIDRLNDVFIKRVDGDGHAALVAARPNIKRCEQRGFFPKMLAEPVDRGMYEYRYQLVPGQLLESIPQKETYSVQVAAELAQLFLGVWNNGLIHWDTSAPHNTIAVDTTDPKAQGLHPFVLIDLDSLYLVNKGDPEVERASLHDWLRSYCSLLFRLWTRIDLHDFMSQMEREGIVLSDLQSSLSLDAELSQDPVGEKTAVAQAIAKILGLRTHVLPSLLILVIGGLDDDHNLTLEDLEKIANQEVS